MTANRAGRCGRSIAAVALGTLALVGPAMGAGASTVSSLSARADAIAGVVEADQARLSAVGARYVVESAELADAKRREAIAESGKAADSRRIGADQASLRASAISAYVEAGSASTIALYLTSGTDNGSAGSAYLNAAGGQLRGQIATLAGDQHRLQVLDSTARAEEARVNTALRQLGSDRATALDALAGERSALTSARGQLADLVAARAAAAARRAEEAAAAAAARAAAASAATTSSAEGAGPPAVTAVLSASTSPIPAGSLAAAFAGIRNCEASGSYTLNTGNGYYGAYQFSASTWTGLGGSGLASAATPSAQDAAAYRLYQANGFAAWPECAAILGL